MKNTMSQHYHHVPQKNTLTITKRKKTFHQQTPRPADNSELQDSLLQLVNHNDRAVHRSFSIVTSLQLLIVLTVQLVPPALLGSDSLFCTSTFIKKIHVGKNAL